MLEGTIAKFRVLKGWDIEMQKREGYSGHCYTNVERKHAIIEEWNGKIEQPDNYILHEVLHIAIRSLQTREQEELLVQDICKLIKRANQNRLME